MLHGQRAGKVRIRNRVGEIQHCIQAASHNYAGLYSRDMEPLYLALDRLPVLTSSQTQSIEADMHRVIALHFEADFCTSMSTGYGANLLALSAILRKDWLLVLDEKSHNSMFVAGYLAGPGKIRKFRHNNVGHLEQVLLEEGWHSERTLVAIEGVSSMDGTTPDLSGLASLKEKYGFALFVDEAHSILCLGSSGRGCVEHWNEANIYRQLPMDVIDVRAASLSKAIGTVGGVVCGTTKFEERVKRRQYEMLCLGSEPITVAACIQTIHLVKQKALVHKNLERLMAMSFFCRQHLAAAGIHVYGEYNSPILPIYAGRPSIALKLSYLLRKQGVVATPISTPAVPFWESRVRICLSAAFDDSTVCELMGRVVAAARIAGLCHNGQVPKANFQHDQGDSSQQEKEELAESNQVVRTLIEQCSFTTEDKPLHGDAMKAAHEALTAYGLGSGGVRWLSGTTELHVQLERSVASLFGDGDAMLYADSYMGILSTVAALCRPVDRYSKHVLLVSEKASPAITHGLRVSKKKGRPSVRYYNDMALLAQLACSHGRSCYLTIAIDTQDIPDQLDFEQFLGQCGELRNSSNTTILIHDDGEFSDLTRYGPFMKSTRPRVLFHGSFYSAFQLPGSFLVGDATLIEELRYTSRSYMFTSSQHPYNVAMIDAELKRVTQAESSPSRN
ncbi:hypothetical protein NX059_001892 [Plenodomus lindquistii]|nr:hypothetical protein NX059_001892 [Plenodomus lindquistii]